MLIGCGTVLVDGRIENPYNQPIGSVKVIVESSNAQVTSNDYGVYHLQTKSTSSLSLRYLKTGYAPLEINFVCQKRQCEAPLVKLTPLDLNVPHQPQLLVPILDSNQDNKK